MVLEDVEVVSQEHVRTHRPAWGDPEEPVSPAILLGAEEAPQNRPLNCYARTLRMTFTSSLSTMRTGRSPLAKSCAWGSIPSWE